MACADLSAPVSMAQTSGEMDSVPTLDLHWIVKLEIKVSFLFDFFLKASWAATSATTDMHARPDRTCCSAKSLISLGRGACTRSKSCSRLPLGAGATAFCSSFAEFLLMDCITAVEPSAKVRVRILPTSDDPAVRNIREGPLCVHPVFKS